MAIPRLNVRTQENMWKRASTKIKYCSSCTPFLDKKETFPCSRATNITKFKLDLSSACNELNSRRKQEKRKRTFLQLLWFAGWRGLWFSTFAVLCIPVPHKLFLPHHHHLQSRSCKDEKFHQHSLKYRFLLSAFDLQSATMIGIPAASILQKDRQWVCIFSHYAKKASRHTPLTLIWASVLGSHLIWSCQEPERGTSFFSWRNTVLKKQNRLISD